MNRDDLQKLIARSLKRQGFRIDGDVIVPPISAEKDQLRKLHATATRHRIDDAEASLRVSETDLLSFIANGKDVEPSSISPILIQVENSGTESELFRYAGLHWSIPISSGYGRRLRFLVVDNNNAKLIGIIGLADPVFSLAARDQWIGWNQDDRRDRLQHVMDAFVLGAVPPYSMLLGGKLVAMLAASNEVRSAFCKKYRGHKALISRKENDGRLALITTTSALGRSSIYNRLRYEGRLLYEPVGFTRGSGDFHFSNGLYGTISDYVQRYCEPTAKNEQWGTGFRNRREVIRKCLAKIGLSSGWAYHGVQREVFVIPLARNTKQFLLGHHSRLYWHAQSADDLFAHFRERWMLPRAAWDRSYFDFSRESYRLWR